MISWRACPQLGQVIVDCKTIKVMGRQLCSYIVRYRGPSLERIGPAGSPTRCIAPSVRAPHGWLRSTPDRRFSARREHGMTLVACGRLIAVVCQGAPTDGVLLIGPHAEALVGRHHRACASVRSSNLGAPTMRMPLWGRCHRIRVLVLVANLLAKPGFRGDMRESKLSSLQ